MHFISFVYITSTLLRRITLALSILSLNTIPMLLFLWIRLVIQISLFIGCKKVYGYYTILKEKEKILTLAL